jgi:hypothetical protein
MTLELLLRIFPYWLQAFVFTLNVEIPLFVAVARLGSGHEKDRRAPLWRLALAGAAGTCLTHPLLWFVWPRVVHDYAAYIASGEILIAVIESATFFALARPISLPRAIAASFVANGASYGLGILLRFWGILG